MPTRPTYRLYIDESGDHTFNLVDTADHRYLALLGIWFHLGEPYQKFAEELEALKRSVFGFRPDRPVCLHRKDILQRRGPFGKLKRDRQLAERFDDGLLEIVRRASFIMACVVIDKKAHQPKTYRQLYHPYHYCLTALLERYAGWLQLMGEVGDVMAESRGRFEDRELGRAFARTYEQGTRFHSADRFQRVLTSSKLKWKKKEHNIPGLELADLLAHPARREIIFESQKKKAPAGTFGARLLEAARPKFNRYLYEARIGGYGKVLLR